MAEIYNNGILALSEGFQLLDDLALRSDSDRFMSKLAALEIEQRWDRLNAELGCQFAFVIDVDFANLNGFAFVFGDFVQNWTKHFARSTPFRPEVHKDRNAGLEDFGLEIVLG